MPAAPSKAYLTCESLGRAAWGEPVKREGEELLYHCANPLRHKNGDAHASLKINTSKNTWACFARGVGGTPWQLVAFITGLDPGNKQAIKAWLR